MNCDNVFAILTRGPFPTGGSRIDAAVESHLRACADCQRLAEALRPNSGLIQESIGIDESRVLPGYWGGSLPLSGDLAVSLDERGIQAGRYPRIRRMPVRLVRSESLKFWQFAAAVALGIALDGAFRTLISVHATEMPVSAREPLQYMLPPNSTMSVSVPNKNEDEIGDVSVSSFDPLCAAQGLTEAPNSNANGNAGTSSPQKADHPIPDYDSCP
ncbi:MAG TPA: hypothetical protein VGI75_11275 [Pirellulales bacterium]|jgi:hypothetical protein